MIEAFKALQENHRQASDNFEALSQNFDSMGKMIKSPQTVNAQGVIELLVNQTTVELKDLSKRMFEKDLPAVLN